MFISNNLKSSDISLNKQIMHEQKKSYLQLLKRIVMIYFTQEENILKHKNHYVKY